MAVLRRVRGHLLTNSAGWIAQQAGLPSWVGAFAAYSIFCLVLAFLLRIVLAPLAWTLRILSRIVGRLDGGGGVSMKRKSGAFVAINGMFILMRLRPPGGNLISLNIL